jgi:hypothetical protein
MHLLASVTKANPVHFSFLLVSFAVDQPYSYVKSLGKDIITDAIRHEMPKFIPGIQSKHIRNVNVFSANGNTFYIALKQ